MNPKKNKTRVLVTGATGYIGSHLVKRLVKESYNVHIILRHDSLLNQLADIKDEINLHYYDGTADSILLIVKNAQPEIVYHLASYVISTHTYKDIDQLIESNVLFGTQLLEALVVNKVPFFINTGTYWQHFNNKEYSPVCLYAATKKAFEDIIRFYTESSALKAITLKLFDTYGPNDPRDKLLNLLKESYLKNKSLSMTPGDQLLDLVHIEDVIEAFIAAKTYIKKNNELQHSHFIISTGEFVSVKQIVSLFEDQVNKLLPIEWGKNPYHSRQIMLPKPLDKKLPGWHAKIKLKEGIQRFVREIC